MTSHRRRSVTMRKTGAGERGATTTTERKKANLRRRISVDTFKASHLPLSDKRIYIDTKNGKQFELMEGQMKKLGARIEKFLSREVHYVISSCVPAKLDDCHNGPADDNPQSPSLANVPSPFNCGPSPTGVGESKKSVVSRGKALAQIACSKSLISTTVASAEKLGIKIVSFDAANKWLDRELKKLEDDNSSKCKTENKGKGKKKTERGRKFKTLKGPFIKFEAFNQQYRPIKSELTAWPKLNLAAPPGICPFGGGRLAIQHQFGPRKTIPKSNKPAQKVAPEVCVEPLKPQDENKNGAGEPAAADVVAVPVVTTGDIKRNLEHRLKKKATKQGFCDCCKMKFQDMDQHVSGEEHKAFIRDKSNYEGLDKAIGIIPSTITFLQSVLLQHCLRKQCDQISSDKGQEDFARSITQVPDPLVSPLTTEKTGNPSLGVAIDLHTPQPEVSPSKEQLTVTDLDFVSNVEVASADVAVSPSAVDRPQAVVIRKPVPSGLFTSPRRRQPTPSKKPRMQECSLVFRDSPMASLQPSSCNSNASFLCDDNASLFSPSMSRTFSQKSPGAEQRKTSSVNRSLTNSLEVGSRNMKAPDDKSAPVTPCLGQSEDSGNSFSVKNDKEKTSESCVPENANHLKGNTRLIISKNDMQLASLNKSLQEDSCKLPSYRVEPGETAPSPSQNNLGTVQSGVKCIPNNSTDIGENAPNFLALEKFEIQVEKCLYDPSKTSPSRQFEDSADVDTIPVVPTIADRVKQRTRNPDVKTDVEGKSCIEVPDQITDFNPECSVNERQADVTEDQDMPVVPRMTRSNPSKGKLLAEDEHLSKNTEIQKRVPSESAPQEDSDKEMEVVEKTGDGDQDRPEKLVPEAEEVQCEKFCQQKKSRKSRTERRKSRSCRLSLFKGSTHTSVAETEKDKSSPETADVRESHSKGRKSESVNVGIKKEAGKTPRVQCDETKPNCQTSSSSDDFIAKSVTKKSRSCKLFNHEGCYANSGEELAIQELGIVVPNIADRVKRRNRTYLSELSADDGTGEDSAFEDVMSFTEKKGCKSKKADVSVKSVTEVSADAVTCHISPETMDDLSAFALEASRDRTGVADHDKQGAGSCVVVVPNIAESVKKRRSCTLFNHKGQYANNGEGEEVLGLEAGNDVDKMSPNFHFDDDFLNIPKRISALKSSNISTASEREEGLKTQGCGRLGTRKDKLSKYGGNTAVVIRRKSSYFPAYSVKGGEANWAKFRSNRDWCVGEETTQTVANDKGISHNEKSRSTVESSKDFHDTLLQKLAGECVPNYDSSCNSPKASTVKRKDSVNSPRAKLAESPRLRLRLRREPNNAGFSSTILEDDVVISSLNSETENSIEEKRLVRDDKKTRRRETRKSKSKRKQTVPSQSATSDTGSVDLLPSPPVLRGRKRHRTGSQTPGNTEESVDCKPTQSEEAKVLSDSKRASKRRKLDFEKSRSERTSNVGSKVADCGQTSGEDLKKATHISDEVTENKAGSPPSPPVLRKGNESSTPKKNVANAEDKEKVIEESVKGKDILLSGKKVKLSDSWKLVSDRSVAKLLESEQDVASFDGFTGSAHDLPSDITYTEASEVEFGASESKDWLLTENSTICHEGTTRTNCTKTNEECGEDLLEGAPANDFGDLLKFVPSFSSPGKAGTDSSWGDICDTYLSTSINLRYTPSTNWTDTTRSPRRRGPMSPFTSPNISFSPKRVRVPDCDKRTPKKSCVREKMSNDLKSKDTQSKCIEALDTFTPVKSRSRGDDSVGSSIQQVDDVVSFNYMSPQRLNFSPIKSPDKSRSIPNKPNFSLLPEVVKSPNHKQRLKVTNTSKPVLSK